MDEMGEMGDYMGGWVIMWVKENDFVGGMGDYVS